MTTIEAARIRGGHAGAIGANEVQSRTIEALQSQIGTAERLDALLSGTNDRLDLLNARLDESVTRAIELSVTNRTSDADALGTDVGHIVDDLENLRVAIADLDHRDPRTTTLPAPSAAPHGSDTTDGRRRGTTGP